MAESSMEEVFERVVTAIWADDPLERRNLLEVLVNRWALFNTPVLVNAGKDRFQAAACFILHTHDSLESILDGGRNAARIYSQTSGCGFDYSLLRPKGMTTSGGAKTSGPVPFMRLLDAIGDTITSGWGARRAACLVQLDDIHPDVLEFIKAKDSGDLLNLNISVRVTDTLNHMPDDLLSVMADSAWKSGDPGLIFGKACDDRSPIATQGRSLHNPCAEVCLPVSDVGNACNLASVNLHKMMTNSGLDVDKFRDVVQTMTRAMDKIVSISHYPVEGMAKVVQYSRPLGLGFTGLGLFLMKLGIPYASTQAEDETRDICRHLTGAAAEESVRMAAEQGPCPAWSNLIDRDRILTRILDLNALYSATFVSDLRKHGIRNAYLTSIAPTGSISWVLGCEASMGIEPGFSLVFLKTTEMGDKIIVINPEFRAQVLTHLESDRTAEFLRDIAKNGGSVRGLELPTLPVNVVEKINAGVFDCAHDVSADWHLRVCAAAQRHISQSISKTVNMPTDSTPGDIVDVYRTAETLGLKSVAIFRDGCKDNSQGWQPMTTGEQITETLLAEVSGLREDASCSVC